MSRIFISPSGRLDAKSLYPLAMAAPIGLVLFAARLQPSHYMLGLTVCVLACVALTRMTRNVGVRSILKRSLFVISFVMLLGLIVMPTKAAIISEYSMAGDFRPFGITLKDNDVWFTELLGGRIGRLSGSTINEWNLPTGGSEPWGIVYNPDPDSDDPNANSVWFTESKAGKIGRLKDDVFVEFKVSNPSGSPISNGFPTAITFDYNVSKGVKYKNVWFVEYTGQAIGKIYYNASGALKNRWIMTEYSLPVNGHVNGPIDLARSPVDGLLYICSFDAGNIASFNPWTYSFRIYYVSNVIGPSYGSYNLQAIAVGSDGIVWAALDFIDSSQYDKIVRLDPWNNMIVTYEIPTKAAGPRDVTVDKDKNVWFTEYDQDKIGRLNPITGYITEYQLPTFGSRPRSVVVNNDGIVWFTEELRNKIGRLDPSLETTRTTVNTITSATSFSGSATTTRSSAPSTTRNVVWSTSTTVSTPGVITTIAAPNVVTFTTAGKTTGGTTMSTFVRFATSSLTSNTETIYVLPTSTTASTTSIFTSYSTTTTTTSATLVTAVSTVTQSTSITTSMTFSTPIQTDTTVITNSQAFTRYVTTTTETQFAATSFRFTTVTNPTFTQYSTSTLVTTKTTTVATITTTQTTYATTTIFTTVTAGMVGSLLLLGVFASLPALKKKLHVAAFDRGEKQ